MTHPETAPIEEGEYAYPTAHYGRPGVYPHSSIAGRELVIQHTPAAGGGITLLVAIRQRRRVRRTTLASLAVSSIEAGDEDWYRACTADLVFDAEALSGDDKINAARAEEY